MTRPWGERPKQQRYFDRIASVMLQSFVAVTPELMQDPERMNLITCVDPYAVNQLDELKSRIPEQQQIKLAGGLGWLDVTGLMKHWIAYRVFIHELAGGLHKNCGGMAIVGAVTGERQAMSRDHTTSLAQRLIAEQAAEVKYLYLERFRKQHKNPELEILVNFSGPRLTVATGNEGTAVPFVMPKSIPHVDMDTVFTPTELNTNVRTWLAAKQLDVKQD